MYNEEPCRTLKLRGRRRTSTLVTQPPSKTLSRLSYLMMLPENKHSFYYRIQSEFLFNHCIYIFGYPEGTIWRNPHVLCKRNVGFNFIHFVVFCYSQFKAFLSYAFVLTGYSSVCLRNPEICFQQFTRGPKLTAVLLNPLWNHRLNPKNIEITTECGEIHCSTATSI